MTYPARPAERPSGVKKPLTPKRPYRVVENDEYAAFLRRVIRAYSRRVAAGDIEAITTMAALASDLEDATRQAITGLRGFGYSWADIAMRLGITRQGAQQRWGDTPEPATDTSTPALTEAARDPTQPALALMPGTRTAPGTGANTGPRQHHIPTGNLAPARLAYCTSSSPTNALRRLHHAGYARLARSRLARRRMHPPDPAARRHQHIDATTGELLRTIPTIGMPDGSIYKAMREPAGHHLPRLRRDLPPRRLPSPPRRADRRQGHHPGRRRAPGRVRHLHRPVVRPGPLPAGPPAHLRRPVPLHMPTAALPRPPQSWPLPA